MTDRDTFAAAALTGLVGECGYHSPKDVAGEAYALADAMLRARKGAVADRETVPVTEPMPKEKRAEVYSTTLDAVPAAIACTDADRDRTDKPATRPGGGTGNTTSGAACAPHADGRGGFPRCPDEPPDVTQPDNGLATSGRGRNTQNPAAWGLPNADGDVLWATSLDREALERHCPTNQSLIPLYRHPQPTTNLDAVPAAIVSTTDENSLHAASELGNPGAASRQGEVTGNTQGPVAWVAFATDGSESSAVYMMQEQAKAAADDWGWGIAPLYRSPTLTDAERAAIDPVDFGGLTDEERKALAYYIGTGGPDTVDAALRTLLERTK